MPEVHGDGFVDEKFRVPDSVMDKPAEDSVNPEALFLSDGIAAPEYEGADEDVAQPEVTIDEKPSGNITPESSIPDAPVMTEAYDSRETTYSQRPVGDQYTPERQVANREGVRLDEIRDREVNKRLHAKINSGDIYPITNYQDERNPVSLVSPADLAGIKQELNTEIRRKNHEALVSQEAIAIVESRFVLEETNKFYINRIERKYLEDEPRELHPVLDFLDEIYDEGMTESLEAEAGNAPRPTMETLLETALPDKKDKEGNVIEAEQTRRHRLNILEGEFSVPARAEKFAGLASAVFKRIKTEELNAYEQEKQAEELERIQEANQPKGLLGRRRPTGETEEPTQHQAEINKIDERITTDQVVSKRARARLHEYLEQLQEHTLEKVYVERDEEESMMIMLHSLGIKKYSLAIDKEMQEDGSSKVVNTSIKLKGLTMDPDEETDPILMFQASLGSPKNIRSIGTKRTSAYINRSVSKGAHGIMTESREAEADHTIQGVDNMPSTHNLSVIPRVVTVDAMNKWLETLKDSNADAGERRYVDVTRLLPTLLNKANENIIAPGIAKVDSVYDEVQKARQNIEFPDVQQALAMNLDGSPATPIEETAGTHNSDLPAIEAGQVVSSPSDNDDKDPWGRNGYI